MAVLLISDREEQIVQRTALGMCTSCIVGGEWTSHGGVVVGADRGKECHHLPWLFLFQDWLKVAEYSFCVSSFCLLSELDWAQGVSHSPSSGGHFSSPQSHEVAFGPYFLLFCLIFSWCWGSDWSWFGCHLEWNSINMSFGKILRGPLQAQQ